MNLESNKKRKQRKVKEEAIRNVRKKNEPERSGSNEAVCSNEVKLAEIPMLLAVAFEKYRRQP